MFVNAASRLGPTLKPEIFIVINERTIRYLLSPVPGPKSYMTNHLVIVSPVRTRSHTRKETRLSFAPDHVRPRLIILVALSVEKHEQSVRQHYTNVLAMNA